MSVVVATNRGGPFLAEALASVTAQTYPHVELVVVDDGSRDPSGISDLVASAGGDGRPHRGVRGERCAEHRVARTRGELLAFLDDDDRWHPDRLRRHVEAMTAQPDAVVSYCGMRTVDVVGTQLVAADQRVARDAGDVIRGRTGIMLPNLMIRRSTFDAVGGFDPAYRQGEDLDLVLAATTLGPFAFVDDVLVDYRYHLGNTTRAYRDLATGIRVILRSRRAQARAAGRKDLDSAYRDRLRANDRFAAWSAARQRGPSSREAGSVPRSDTSPGPHASRRRRRSAGCGNGSADCGDAWRTRGALAPVRRRDDRGGVRDAPEPPPALQLSRQTRSERSPGAEPSRPCGTPCRRGRSRGRRAPDRAAREQ
ncbi:glycosyltransferase family A protein [Oerskovia sp. M15]